MRLIIVSKKVVNLDLVTDMTIDPVDGSVTMYLSTPGVNNPSLVFKGKDAAAIRGWLEMHADNLTPETDEDEL
ncbi:MAG TPA: hypothetical protein VE268_04955 [Herpetosiphonaceae bacterium]|jgi:hypothetical protein|nr:hypothetical protein [Herpetosiphonaceae bacterium]